MWRVKHRFTKWPRPGHQSSAVWAYSDESKARAKYNKIAESLDRGEVHLIDPAGEVIEITTPEAVYVPPSSTINDENSIEEEN